MKQFPFYHLVPKDYAANIQWRKELLEIGRRGPSYAAALNDMCRRDLLFWVNSFVFTYDPRKQPSAIPFITWGFQDDALAELSECLGKEDMAWEKSRDMGASWLNLLAFDHRFLFEPYQSFLLVSRVEDLVDKKNDPDCLMWKLDFIHKMLPDWQRPVIERARLSLKNVELESTIMGCSTTGEAGRGGRKTAALLDEFAAVTEGHAMMSATRDMTNCRIYNSTPKGGEGNAFYSVIRNSKIKKLRLHWSMHPEKARGLYSSTRIHGNAPWELRILDEKHVFEVDYPFILDGKVRSPWYDLQCRRASHWTEIAQELDIDYLGSAFQYFSADVIEKHIEMYCGRGAIHVGDLNYDRDTGQCHGFTENSSGLARIYMDLGPLGIVPRSERYLVMADVAQGTGASNSTLAVWSKRERRKVCSVVSAKHTPEEWATYAVAVANFFNGAELGWESNGPGRSFGAKVQSLRYPRLVDFPDPTKSNGQRSRSDFLGFTTTRNSKETIFGAYRQALKDNRIENPDSESLREALEYVFDPGSGSIIHSRSSDKTDPSGARDNHGDRVIADALSVWMLGVGGDVAQVVPMDEIPMGSLAYRRKLREAEKRAQDARYAI